MKERKEDQRERKRRAYRLGLRAEGMVSFILFCRGYRILGRRFRTSLGEIDLIVRRGTHFSFFEVKGRSGPAEGGEVLSSFQVRRIRNAASVWLQKEARKGQLPPCWSASLNLVVVYPLYHFFVYGRCFEFSEIL
ncbi:MAG: YraN family protein [Alphaproteobacteria bacterium]|nr:YraN family protein [Alphaproteobacteria bacterium]